MTPPIPECVAALSVQEICIMADDPENPPVPNPPLVPVEPDEDDVRSGGGGGGNPPPPNAD